VSGKNGKATVSLCMIVRNEESRLAECLSPVARLFDEVVIVDTGSVDATPKIAANFTSQVFHFAWRDDFSAARNESLRHATGDWIFWLDADDRLSPPNIARLEGCLGQLNGQSHAYFMNTACRSQYACEGENLITHIRLFRRHPELMWRGRVHEQLRPDVTSLGFDLKWSDVCIEHTGYEDPVIEQRKLQRDLRLLRMDFAADPEDTSTLVHLGLAYYHLGRFGLAREHLERLLAISPQPGDHLRQVYGVLTSISMREGNFGEALATLNRALAMFPDDEHLLYLRAESFYEMDRYREARAALGQIFLVGQQRQYRGGVPSDIRNLRAPRKLADICRLERDFAQAEAILQNLIAQYPHDTRSWHMLGRVYVDWRQPQKLAVVLDRLRGCAQGDVFAELLASLWHMSAREFDAAGAAIERLIGLAPQMPMPRILRIELLTHTQAPLAARIQACRDLLRIQPGNHEAQQLLASLESTLAPRGQSPARPTSSPIVMEASTAMAAV
jgi:tetratricopeptide (TPR) repeat protein